MNAVLEDMRIKAQSTTTDDWKPDYTLNKNASLMKIGRLVRDAFDYFHDEDDEEKDSARDCLFSLLEELFPGAVRVAPVNFVNTTEEITTPKAKPLVTGGISRIKTGLGENDVECIEGLLMKAATVHMVLNAFDTYSEQIAACGGQEEEHNVPPDTWAIRSAFESIMDISKTLKCARWGHRLASLC
jgi:hypothetical protein